MLKVHSSVVDVERQFLVGSELIEARLALQGPQFEQ